MLFLSSTLDKNELLAAKTFLEHAAASNLSAFLKALSDVLVNVSNSSVARTAAGLQLKNHLTSKDSTTNLQQQQAWLQFPSDVRDYIKKNVSIFNFLFDNAKLLTNLTHNFLRRLLIRWVQKQHVHHQQRNVLQA